jgi:tetrahydromethanopterin S-methyltransferase subunit D
MVHVVMLGCPPATMHMRTVLTAVAVVLAAATSVVGHASAAIVPIQLHPINKHYFLFRGEVSGPEALVHAVQ